MIFCTRCGSQNTDDAQVCVQCQSYLSTINKVHSQNVRINTNTLINILGITNGIISLVLGVITFSLSSLREDTRYILEKEMGEELEQFLDLFLSPAKAFSFGMGSLLVVFGLLIILYFINKLFQKRK